MVTAAPPTDSISPFGATAILSIGAPGRHAAGVEPLTFKPLYMERVWGGRELERVYGRTLPDPVLPYGESWEIVDRERDQSVVDHGPLAGTSLHELWTTRREEIFGEGYSEHARFPLLVKVLDARDDLSLQVHPSAQMAARFGAEPKTEMWFIADCDPGAKLYVGLKQGITREHFEQAITRGTVADCVHAIAPRPGDSILLDSGRLHGIGAGFLIHEIQQNSDSTFRVFDWNRPGLDGRPRELHVAQSLACIDFHDIEPAMDPPAGDTLAACAYFHATRQLLAAGDHVAAPDPGKFAILSVVDGALVGAAGRRFGPGSFLLLPRGAAPLRATESATVLLVTLPG